MKLENLIVLKLIFNSKNKEIKNSSKTLIFAIVFSIIFYIISVSIMNGYIEGTTQFALNIKSYHLQLKDLENYSIAEKYREFLSKNRLTEYITIVSEKKCLLINKNYEKAISFLRGVDENIFFEDKSFSKSIKIIEGKVDLSNSNIMITEKIKNRLKINVGDTIYIATNEPFIIRKVKISSIFTTGLTDYDDQFALIGLDTYKNFFKNDRYSLFIKLKDFRNSEKFLRENLVNGIYGLTTWYQENYNDLTSIIFQKNIITLIVVLVLFVGCLNILSTLMITIREKRETIGLLKAIGLKQSRIEYIFFLYSNILTFIGIVFGVSLGLLFSNNIDFLLNILSEIIYFFEMIISKILTIIFNITIQLRKIEFFSKEFYFDRIYTYISTEEMIFIIFITYLFTIISSIYPIIKLKKLKTNEVLQNE